ncbi:MAG: transporter substrate-binding domain-containing protein [Rickettsiaceae bacterium]|nr:transporter substrate-binding domain-containing protein [Rickettsiaceae bacterium]
MIFRKILFLLSIYLCLDAKSEDKVYVIGIEDTSKYPFHYIDGNSYKGRYREILEQFAKSNKIKFSYKPLPLELLHQELENGSIDFRFPDNPVWQSSKKEESQVIYSVAFTHFLNGFFVKTKDINKKLNTLHRIGYVNDDILRSIEKKPHEEKGVAIKSSSCAELVTMLIRGEINAIFCNCDIVNYMLKDSSILERIAFNANLPILDGYLHISSIKYLDMIKKFDIWIERNRDYIEKKAHEF